MAGCAGNKPATVISGECKVFDGPEYIVEGKNKYSQDWIDETVEGGLAACPNWKRPTKKPPQAMPVKAPPKKKPSLIDRWRIWRP